MDENHNSIKRLKTIEKSLDPNEFIAELSMNIEKKREV